MCRKELDNLMEWFNFDGYEDLLFLGDTDSMIYTYRKCTGFLWDDSEKGYQLCETVPSDFKWIDKGRERLKHSAHGSAFDDEYYI